MRINVIIPCYNVENYLEQAVYSVLNQPCKEIGVILVDDGSLGRTPQLCDELAAREERVYVIHTANHGVSDARNTGIEYVLENMPHRGRDFIAFLDGDDIWAPGVIDDEVAEHLDTDWTEDVIGFTGVLGNNSLSRYSVKLSTLDAAGIGAREAMWDAQLVTFGSKLYSLDVVRNWNIRFLSGQKYSEDRMFCVQFYFLANTARFVNKTLYIYRKNRAGAMGALRKMTAQGYYLPIVDGWLKNDAFLNGLFDRTHTTAQMGQGLASIYLVEMVAEQMKKWGSFREITEILRSHPLYPVVKSAELVRNAPREYAVNRMFFEHPMRFRMKYRLIGAAEWVMRKLLTVPVINVLWERKRYPFTDIPR